VQGKRYDLVLHAGDIAYDLHKATPALCSDKTCAPRNIGDAFMEDIQPIASHVPYMVAPGNHEDYANFSHYKARFTTPGWADGSWNENLFWSTDVGLVHFVGYNTEAYFDGPINVTVQQQYDWLKADLKKANSNRETVPWIVVMGHRPFYCNVAAHRNGSLFCDEEQEQSRVGPASQHGQYAMEELLHEYGVDLALFGHVHDYSRFLPVYQHSVKNGSAAAPFVNPGATVYVTIGGAGNPEMPQPPVSKCSTWDPFQNCTKIPQTPWLVGESGYFPKCPNFNYGRIDVVNATHLHWEQVSVTRPGRGVNGTVIQNASVVSPGVVIDDFWLIQSNHGRFTE